MLQAIQTTDAGRLRLSKATSPQSLLALRAYNTTVVNEGLPPALTPSEVAVDVQISLERPRDKERCLENAKQVQQVVQEGLQKHFSATPESATFRLKVYVVLASERSAWNGWTRGMMGAATEECLEWFLESKDGSTILQSGRVGSRTRQNLLQLAPKLVQEIVDKVERSNDSPA